MRVFDRLIDTNCSSPTEFQFGAGRRNLLESLGSRSRGVDFVGNLPERSETLRWNRLLEPIDLTCILKRAAEPGSRWGRRSGRAHR